MKPTLAILAGGRGTRLGLGDLPKPMAPVAGRPFLEYLVEQGRAAGCEILLLIGFRGERIRAHFGGSVRYSEEATPLGTAGALRHAMDRIEGDPFFVANGDSFCPLSFENLRSFHEARQARATIAVTENPDRSRFGSVEIAPSGEVVRFAEKNPAVGPGLVNAGVYVLTREVVLAGVESLERDVFPSLVGGGLFAHRTTAPMIDIGTPRSLEEAQTLLPGWL